MKNIEWIFFDVGGVLLDDTFPESKRQQGVLELARKAHPELTEVDMRNAWMEASKIIGSIRESALRVLITDNNAYKTALDELATIISPPGFYLENSHVRPEAQAVLEILSKHYELGILANQSTETAGYLKNAGILQYFSHQKMSAHHNLTKPDPAYFEAVLKDTGANPTTSAFIDDNWIRGLRPAQKIGMATILYERDIVPFPTDATPDYRIKNLSELLTIFQ